jgi:tryptophan halogenase
MKIVVIGGGTAGWLAALMVKKVQGDSHSVTVIESSEIGIIGAGEGSTGQLVDIIRGISWDYGCNEADFLVETGATIKLGIIHRDWKELGHQYIAPLDGTAVSAVGTDYIMMHAVLNDLLVHTSSTNGFMIENNLSSYFWENEKISSTSSHAYHFDGHKVGKYFKKVCGEDVSVIDAKVLDINVNQNGEIGSLVLDNGTTIEADFFIDASGFSRLISKKLGIKWESYKDNLPVDTAIPFLLPEEETIRPVTTAWAQKNGWMWMIPVNGRRGCGYVFDSDFITDTEAVKEIEQTLGMEISPIKTIKFEAGRLEKLWHKNCLFVGLAGAFAEPLEATSIHSTIIQLNNFIFHYLKDSKEETVNSGSESRYNKKMRLMYDDFKDFLSVHYASKRTDSDFWKWVSSRETLSDGAKEVLEMQRSKLLSTGDFNQYFGYAGPALYNWVLHGLGFIDKNTAKRELDFFGQHELGQTVWSLNADSMNEMASKMIDNTVFIKNVKEYADGNLFSK